VPLACLSTWYSMLNLVGVSSSSFSFFFFFFMEGYKKEAMNALPWSDVAGVHRL